ncbi:MAG: hypothetical protein KAQ99_00645 [Candidatus Aureabacteria bacterium]|nr:hypothetical protein [Candidatus Auribacterota bacterium]
MSSKKIKTPIDKKKFMCNNFFSFLVDKLFLIRMPAIGADFTGVCSVNLGPFLLLGSKISYKKVKL